MELQDFEYNSPILPLSDRREEDLLHSRIISILPTLLTSNLYNNIEREDFIPSITNLSRLYYPENDRDSIYSNPIISYNEPRNLEIQTPRNINENSIIFRSLLLDSDRNQYQNNYFNISNENEPSGYSEQGRYERSRLDGLRGTPAEFPRNIADLLENIGASRPEVTWPNTGNIALQDFETVLRPQPFQVPQIGGLVERRSDLVGAHGTRFTPTVSYGIVYEEFSLPSNTPYLRVDFTPHGMLHRDSLSRTGHTTTETILGGVKDLRTILDSEGFQLYIAQNTAIVGTTNAVMANFAVRKLGFRYVKDYTGDNTGSRTVYTTCGNLNALKSRLAQVEAKLEERRQNVLSA
jgi:hypothetical protein